ncbi:HD domain-containing phosphohydrolase [Clostridium sp. AN503]|uniref:HD-GYP domain-containing protein n=1 Tax=Clostridium sp. AN503 TaxID=3160598 RepID=UPI0034576851
MPEQIKIAHIDAAAAVYAVNATLRRIDERLVDHGERVAFIACELCEEGNLPMDMKTLFLLCAFHDIGAYKTDEIDRMLEFETHDVWNHSVYGYLFMKYMSPLKESAEAILYHHTSWDDLCRTDTDQRDYASLIHLADRIDIAFTYGLDAAGIERLMHDVKDLFRADYSEIARTCYHKHEMFEQLADGSYLQKNRKRLEEFFPIADETLEYLKMIVYAIDFRSEHTVTHTINTVSLALDIARHFGFTKEELEKIYLGALLHDVGKIAIPVSILEYPGKLAPEEMEVMRTHVKETEYLIRGIVPEEICRIAVRHHEKLNGSGYPYGLTGDDLTLPERIVAVADIVSALSSRRSYKEPFPREKTLKILEQMSKSQLDPSVCAYVSEHYDSIMKSTEPDRIRIIEMYQSIMQEYERVAARMEAMGM